MNRGAQPSGSANALQVRGASKSYGMNRALADFDLDVAHGEFVVLLGPNGAGKTTLFQLLSGLFVPDAGSILIDGIDLRRRPVPALARMGIVFQQPALDLDLTVWANLMFHARLHGCGKRARSRIRDALARLYLTDLADAPVRTLSGGNRRKVELARCLIHEPQVLLMDEATVGLDPGSRRQLLQYVHELCRETRIGVLWATHLVDEAEGAGHVVILNRGRKQAEGSSAELLAGGRTESLVDMLVELGKEDAPLREASE